MTDNRRWMALGLVTAVSAGAAVASNLVIARMVAVPEAELGAGDLLLAEGDAFDPGLEAPRADLAAFGSARRLSEEQYLEGILGRNIFDMNAIGVADVGGEGGGEGEGVSDLNVTLRGTIVAVPAIYSAAFILEEGKKTSYAYGIGQKILDAEILEIEEDRVRIRRGDGREEYLTMSSKEPVAAPTAAKPEGDAVAEGQVQQIDETTFIVDRSMIQQYTDDVAALSRMGRALLHRGADGEFDGYRLSAIRRGSLPDQLGIRNGDIIHNVNGMDLNSVQGAMQALQALQSESGLEFKVTRRGQPVTLKYEVR